MVMQAKTALLEPNFVDMPKHQVAFYVFDAAFTLKARNESEQMQEYLKDQILVFENVWHKVRNELAPTYGAKEDCNARRINRDFYRWRNKFSVEKDNFSLKGFLTPSGINCEPAWLSMQQKEKDGLLKFFEDRLMFPRDL